MIFFKHDEITPERLGDMIRFKFIRAKEVKNGISFIFLESGQEMTHDEEIKAFSNLCRTQGLSFFTPGEKKSARASWDY